MPNKKLNLLILTFSLIVSYKLIGRVDGMNAFILQCMQTAGIGSTLVAFFLYRRTPEQRATDDLRKSLEEGIKANAQLRKALDRHIEANRILQTSMEECIVAAKTAQEEARVQIRQLLVEDKDKLLYGYLKNKFEGNISENVRQSIEAATIKS